MGKNHGIVGRSKLSNKGSDISNAKGELGFQSLVGAAAPAPAKAVTSLIPSKYLSSFKLVGLFTLWYAFNAGCK